MKKYLFVSMIVLAFVACQKGDAGPEGQQGPAGPTGPQGPQGPQGISGNANVRQYTFGSQNLTASFGQLQITTTLDTMNRSQWFVYLFYQPLDRWYFVPGYGYAAATQYRLSMGFSGGKVNIYIDKVGAGETYAQARVIRIYASSETTGGVAYGGRSGVNSVDVTDYEAMRQYYNLPR